MKPSEKKMIIILVIISVMIIGTISLFAKNKRERENQAGVNEINTPEEEFVDVLEDGTKLNNSNALHKTKTIDGLEISDLQLTQKGNETLLLGTVTNKGTVEKTEVINITLIDKTGKELETLPAYIEGIKPGESTELIVSCGLDYSNAYDFKVSN